MTHYSPRRIDYPEFIRTMPDENVVSPRDDRLLASSMDFLFIGLILKNWNKDIDLLNLFKDADKKYIYFLADKLGMHYHPVTGKAVSVDILMPHSKLNKKTVRSYIKKRFYNFRKYLTRQTANEHTIKINDMDIFLKGSLIPENLAKLNDSIKWKLMNKNDIIDDFSNYIDVDINTPPRAEYDAICPVDGYINTIYGEIISPEWTWIHLCGRHYRGKLCPHCLGSFGFQLVCMS